LLNAGLLCRVAALKLFSGAIGSRYGDPIPSGAKKGPSAPSMGQVRKLAMLEPANEGS
jgi:hypothetical protein